MDFAELTTGPIEGGCADHHLRKNPRRYPSGDDRGRDIVGGLGLE